MLEGHWVSIGFSKKKVVPNPGFRSKSHQCEKVKHWKPLQLMWFIFLTCFNTSVSHGTNEWPENNFHTSHHAPSLPWRDCGWDRPKESEVKIFGWLCVCVCCFMRWYILHRYLLLSGYPWKEKSTANVLQPLGIFKVHGLFLGALQCAVQTWQFQKKTQWWLLCCLPMAFTILCFVNQSILL